MSAQRPGKLGRLGPRHPARPAPGTRRARHPASPSDTTAPSCAADATAHSTGTHSTLDRPKRLTAPRLTGADHGPAVPWTRSPGLVLDHSPPLRCRAPGQAGSLPSAGLDASGEDRRSSAWVECGQPSGRCGARVADMESMSQEQLTATGRRGEYGPRSGFGENRPQQGRADAAPLTTGGNTKVVDDRSGSTDVRPRDPRRIPIHGRSRRVVAQRHTALNGSRRRRGDEEVLGMASVVTFRAFSQRATVDERR